MRVRSSVKWTALTGVTPGTSGSSLKDPVAVAVTATLNDWVAPRPLGSVALTVTVAVPAATDVTVTVLPDTVVAATAGADEVARQVSGSPSGSRNPAATSRETAASSTRASCEIVIGSGFFTRSAIARDGQRPVRRVWRMAVNPS